MSEKTTPSFLPSLIVYSIAPSTTPLLLCADAFFDSPFWEFVFLLKFSQICILSRGSCEVVLSIRDIFFVLCPVLIYQCIFVLLVCPIQCVLCCVVYRCIDVCSRLWVYSKYLVVSSTTTRKCFSGRSECVYQVHQQVSSLLCPVIRFFSVLCHRFVVRRWRKRSRGRSTASSAHHLRSSSSSSTSSSTHSYTPSPEQHTHLFLSSSSVGFVAANRWICSEVKVSGQQHSHFSPFLADVDAIVNGK